MEFSFDASTLEGLGQSIEPALDSALGTVAGTAVVSSFFGALAAFFVAYGFIVCLLGILMIVAQWIIFKKAGQPGWAAIIPIYNAVVLFKTVKLNAWLVLLLLIPIANVVLLIVAYLRLAKVFGKGTGFGVGLILLNVVFMPILAFGNAKYNAEAVAKVE